MTAKEFIRAGLHPYRPTDRWLASGLDQLPRMIEIMDEMRRQNVDPNDREYLCRVLLDLDAMSIFDREVPWVKACTRMPAPPVSLVAHHG